MVKGIYRNNYYLLSEPHTKFINGFRSRIIIFRILEKSSPDRLWGPPSLPGGKAAGE
jgi:hypothetical protein